MPKTIAKPGYKSQAADTSIDADLQQFSLLRKWSLGDRLQLSAKLSRHLRALCLAGIKQRCPTGSALERRTQFDRAVLAEKLHPGFRPKLVDETMWIQDSIELAEQLHSILEANAIPYYVGGGVASSAHGEPRATRDLDLIVQIQPEALSVLVEILEVHHFYCPEGAVEEIKQGRSRMLNITNIETSANADLFIMDVSPFAQSQMARRSLISVDGTHQFWICSAEDTVLQKLLWRRSSQSEQQWRDVLGVLKVQVDHLDYSYLAEWAEQLGILDVLSQAFVAAGV